MKSKTLPSFWDAYQTLPDEAKKAAIVEQSEIILTAGRAGVQIIDGALLKQATRLKVALDINAVPPPGIEGVDAFAKGTPVAGTGAVGFGALAVGNVKYQAEHEMLQAMADADPRQYLSIDEALAAARRHVG